MRQEKLKRHKGRRLSNEQVAAASVLAHAISEYSEDLYCAGWSSDIEHTLWNVIHPNKPDAYELAVKTLYAAARQKQPNRAGSSAEFLEGLKAVAKRFQVWVYFIEDKTAIHLKDWLPLHQKWYEDQKKLRPRLDEVWLRIHDPFPYLRTTDAPAIPPMPKLR